MKKFACYSVFKRMLESTNLSYSHVCRMTCWATKVACGTAEPCNELPVAECTGAGAMLSPSLSLIAPLLILLLVRHFS